MAKKLPLTDISAHSHAEIVEWLESPDISAEFLIPQLKYSIGFDPFYAPGIEPIVETRNDGGLGIWPEPAAEKVETELYAHEILTEVRPLKDDDDAYTLLMSIDGWTTFEQWFGDAGNFEVWMRDSDLRGRKFDQAWCLIRTD